MNKKNSKTKIALISFSSILLICAICIGLWTAYWSQRHLFVSNVDSITAYQFENNENCYRFEIRGTMKNWYYDFKTYENIALVGDAPGGEPMYFKESTIYEPITVSKKASNFLIILDVDESTYNWGNGLEENVHSWLFYCPEISDSRYALFMADFKDVPVIWAEPRQVTNSLLNN